MNTKVGINFILENVGGLLEIAQLDEECWMQNPYDLAADENASRLVITDQHREIAKAVHKLKQHLGQLGMIESALAIYDEINRDRKR